MTTVRELRNIMMAVTRFNAQNPPGTLVDFYLPERQTTGSGRVQRAFITTGPRRTAALVQLEGVEVGVPVECVAIPAKTMAAGCGGAQ